MHGYASFILNYELERLWPGESSVTEREREREKAAIRLHLVELVGNLEKVDESETFDISDTDCMFGWLSIGVFILLLLWTSSTSPTDLRH